MLKTWNLIGDHECKITINCVWNSCAVGILLDWVDFFFKFFIKYLVIKMNLRILTDFVMFILQLLCFNYQNKKYLPCHPTENQY